MMKIVSGVVLLLFVSSALGQSAYIETDDTSLDQQFHARYLSVGTWDLFGYHGAWINSVQLDVNNSTEPSVSGDFIWGSVYAGSGLYPISYLAYFGASANAERNVTNTTGWATFSVDATAAFIGSGFLKIVEKDQDGNVVDGLDFSDFTLKWDRDDALSRSLSNYSAGIYVIVFTTTKGSVNIQLQYVVVRKPGIINNTFVGSITMVPKSIESIITITGWGYKNSSNYLALRVGVAGAKGSLQKSGQISFGSGTSRTFFYFSKSVYVDSKLTSVGAIAVEQVNISKAFGLTAFSLQAQSKYGSDGGCFIVEIPFPAGANSITYDPTTGTGDSPYDDIQNPSNLGLIVGLVVTAVILICAVIGVTVYLRRRSGYAPVA
eukprot:TRINITY_DN10779_c0_g1_i1.p1 TRINITY_DN10779_c0_g1~~TRINITY_DN10779_c0_g1_i1.p1  ORF type:complete len:377 (-),score=65.18 TRINITY_DN10779_c0_g1_i1:55-1185(-)